MLNSTILFIIIKMFSFFHELYIYINMIYSQNAIYMLLGLLIVLYILYLMYPKMYSNKIEENFKGSNGDVCSKNSDCKSGSCNGRWIGTRYTYQCQN
jgi:cobalamin synthase